MNDQCLSTPSDYPLDASMTLDEISSASASMLCLIFKEFIASKPAWHISSCTSQNPNAPWDCHICISPKPPLIGSPMGHVWGMSHGNPTVASVSLFWVARINRRIGRGKTLQRVGPRETAPAMPSASSERSATGDTTSV